MAAERPGAVNPTRSVTRAAVVAAAVLLVALAAFFIVKSTEDPQSVSAPASASTTLESTGTTNPSIAVTPSPSVPSPSQGTSAAPPPMASANVTPSSSAGVAPAAGTPRPTPPPVSLTASATPVGGVVTTLARIEKVQGVSNLPGEIAGPALRVTVRFSNNTAAPVDLSGTVVNLYTGKELTPAIPLTQPGGRPFPASVQSGASADGVFVFNVPLSERSAVRIEVDLSNQGNVLLFQGPVS